MAAGRRGAKNRRGAARSADRRRFPRYECDVEVTCRPTGLAAGEPVWGCVRDVSLGGARLVVGLPLARGLFLGVDLKGAGGSVLARVLHRRVARDGEWSLGCAFVSPLAEEDLAAFGVSPRSAPAPDRRARPRSACRLLAWVQPLKGGGPAAEPAAVRDVSPRGVGLWVGRPLPVGKVVDLELGRKPGAPALRTLACVTRTLPGPDGLWSVGCHFVRELTAGELTAVLARGEAVGPRRGRPPRHPFSLPGLPAAAER